MEEIIKELRLVVANYNPTKNEKEDLPVKELDGTDNPDDVSYITQRTDKYFSKSRRIVERFGEKEVKYGIFMRREVIAALNPAVEFIKKYCPEAKIEKMYPEGTLVPGKSKLLQITGPLSKLTELETLILQKIGFSCVCAYNAYRMSLYLPNVSFIDMHARHATGDDMVVAAAYGASVGSKSAKLQGSKGFIGSSVDLTARFYDTPFGIGTMPHLVIGYAGSTLRATQMYIESNPEDTSITTLVDYFGKEVSDSLEVARWFFDEATENTKGKTLGLRLDTHGGRFMEGLDYQKSVDEIANWLRIPGADEYEVVRHIVGNDVADSAGDAYLDQVRKMLFAQGVSVASLIHIRRILSKSGYPQVKLVASSGFDLQKCKIFAQANAPVDIIGTGSFLPKTISETYSTCDAYEWNGVKSVKVGREFLFE